MLEAVINGLGEYDDVVQVKKGKMLAYECEYDVDYVFKRGRGVL